jgi:hypothetical protein
MSGFKTVRDWWASLGSRHDTIPGDIRERLPLTAIEKVTFFKRDEITTELICCTVQARDQVWFFHEDAEGWDALVSYLACLPGFKADWYEAVVQPPFAISETVAYARA